MSTAVWLSAGVVNTSLPVAGIVELRGMIFDATPPMVATVLGDRSVGTAGMSIRPDAAPPAATPPLTHGAFAALAGVETDRRPNRDALFAALGRLGIDPVTNASLSAMATTPGLDFADEPMMAAT